MTQAGISERGLGSVGELTPERLRELRRIAEAGPAGEWDMIELEHSTVLAMLDEIERLRREREARELLGQLRDALRAALEWIDAVPRDIVLPTMPGFDRDWAESLVHDVKGAARMSDGTERWRAVRKRNPKIIAYEYAAQVIDTAIDGGIVLEGLDERELAKVEEALADIAASLERRAKRMRERPGGATDGR